MRRAFAVVAVFVAVFGFSACSTNASGKARPPAPPIDLRGRSHVDIDAQYNLFTPADVVVSPGTIVTWHNKDSVTHDVEKATDTADFHGNFGVEPQHFGPGASYSYKFTTPGSDYSYVCTIHTGMSGRVEVVGSTTAPTTTLAR